jgi:hypothetical protein
MRSGEVADMTRTSKSQYYAGAEMVCGIVGIFLDDEDPFPPD